MSEYEYDAFICHSSEDKPSVVAPLAAALLNHGCRIWYDDLTLKIGDSLSRKIDEGLEKSRFGLVVLSPSFFNKNWTRYELDGLVAREMADATKVILPIWHEVQAADVRAFSLPLSIRLAGNTAKGIESLASELVEVIGNSQPPQNLIAVQDDLAKAKQVVLTNALKNNGQIFIHPASNGKGKSYAANYFAYNDSEKQRKLYLHAIENLQAAGLVERVSDTSFELTYPGHQAAQRIDSHEDGKLLGMS